MDESGEQVELNTKEDTEECFDDDEEDSSSLINDAHPDVPCPNRSRAYRLAYVFPILILGFLFLITQAPANAGNVPVFDFAFLDVVFRALHIHHPHHAIDEYPVEVLGENNPNMDDEYSLSVEAMDNRAYAPDLNISAAILDNVNFGIPLSDTAQPIAGDFGGNNAIVDDQYPLGSEAVDNRTYNEDLDIPAAILENLNFEITLDDTVQPVDIPHEIERMMNTDEVDGPEEDDQIDTDESHSSDSETDSLIDNEEHMSPEIPSREPESSAELLANERGDDVTTDTEQREVISSYGSTTNDESNGDEHSAQTAEARSGNVDPFDTNAYHATDEAAFSTVPKPNEQANNVENPLPPGETSSANDMSQIISTSDNLIDNDQSNDGNSIAQLGIQTARMSSASSGSPSEAQRATDEKNGAAQDAAASTNPELGKRSNPSIDSNEQALQQEPE